MTLTFDVRTVLLLSAAIVAVFLLSMLMHWRRAPDDRAIRCWTLGAAALTLGYVMLALRGAIPDAASIVAANTLQILGLCCLLWGIEYFLDTPRSWPFGTAVTAITVVTFAIFTYVEESLFIRILLAATLAGSIGAVGLRRCLRGHLHAYGPGGTLITIIMGLVVAVAVVRLLLTLQVPVFGDFMEAGSIQSLVLVAHLATLVAFNVGFNLLIAERLRRWFTAELKARDRFLSILAHDVRTPFNAILGMTEAMAVLAERGRTDRVLENAQLVHRAGLSVFALIDSLLAWGRTLSGGSGGTAPSALVAGCIDTVRGQLATFAGAKKVRIAVEVPSIAVAMDPQALETVLRNLLTNAVKFSDAESTVRVTAGGTDAGMAAIRIQDDGVGIDPEKLAALHRGEARDSLAGTDGEPGTGLGLALTQQLVDHAGGRVAIDSEPGRGTAVTVTLPLAPLP